MEPGPRTVSSASARPNIVVIVLDCARASEFPAPSNGGPGLPFFRWLAGESLVFSRAVSPTSWTIPSHASLFTGLYPWDHGVHKRASLQLKPGLPTVAELLRDRGYATVSLSASPAISPRIGLTRGFVSAAWGRWSEKWSRTLDRIHPLLGYEIGPTDSLSGRELRSVTGRTFSLADRAPVLFDTANRLRANVRGRSFVPIISPWIEPTFERWLGERSPTEPVFAFMNFLEPHEPYFLTPQLRAQPGVWRRFLRARMDRINLLAGRWHPTPGEIEFLHRLYQGVYPLLDERVRRVVEILQRAGRWNDTLLVVTSDHGQAFGEHDFLFHEIYLWESMLRIPLYVRFPRSAGAGTVVANWAGLTDVAPTVLEAAGVDVAPGREVVSLRTLLDRPRPMPVWAVGDGIARPGPLDRVATSERIDQLDEPRIAGYRADRKLIVDARVGTHVAYDLARDPHELVDRSGPLGDELADLLQDARDRGQWLQGAVRAPIPADIEDRLRSWGY